MAVDYFLKLDGIKGESQDDKHKEQIDVMSFSWGLSQSGTRAFGGGAGAGKVQFQDLSISKKIDVSSPVLFLKCATGEHIKEGLITARKAGDKQQDFLKIKLTDVLVSSYQSAGPSGGDLPTDALTLSFAAIEFSYFPQQPDGTVGAPNEAGWDLGANKKV